MNENRRAQLFRGTPHRLKRGIIQIQNIHATGVLVRVDMRSDLCAAQAQVADATFQLTRGPVRVLQGKGGQADKAFRMFANDFGDVVVQSP